MNSLQITLVVFDTQIVAVPNCAAVYLRINSEILLFSYSVGGGQMLEAAGVQHNIITRHFHQNHLFQFKHTTTYRIFIFISNI